MKALIAATLLVALAGWSVDSQRRPRWTFEDRGLTTEQVSHYAVAYMPGVRSCYVRYAPAAAPGTIVLHATVLRDGTLTAIEVDAPGVTGRALKRLAACVRDDAATWRFPVARVDTDVAIPYFFQRTQLR